MASVVGVIEVNCSFSNVIVSRDVIYDVIRIFVDRAATERRLNARPFLAVRKEEEKQDTISYSHLVSVSCEAS